MAMLVYHGGYTSYESHAKKNAARSPCLQDAKLSAMPFKPLENSTISPAYHFMRGSISTEIRTKNGRKLSSEILVVAHRDPYVMVSEIIPILLCRMSSPIGLP